MEILTWVGHIFIMHYLEWSKAEQGIKYTKGIRPIHGKIINKPWVDINYFNLNKKKLKKNNLNLCC